MKIFYLWFLWLCGISAAFASPEKAARWVESVLPDHLRGKPPTEKIEALKGDMPNDFSYQDLVEAVLATQ